MQEKMTTLRAEAIAPLASELARNLGRRLRYLRAQHSETQAELADRAQTGRAHLSRLERGKTLPRYFTLVRLAACLGVHPAELMGGETGAPGNGPRNPDRAIVPQ
ncbi:MAG: helix-turn-helix transcriptional regulator [Terracidiphilus sp.]|jgi:transcriptional regulator with XRE-family HTH domain